MQDLMNPDRREPQSPPQNRVTRGGRLVLLALVAAGGWACAASDVDPGGMGSAGTDGTAGAAGTQGSAGTNGAAGSTGLAGSIGSVGTNGAAGTSGGAGTNGAAGTQASGTTGGAGTTGVAGTNGGAGRGGTNGAAGSNGAAGRGGTNGAAGSNGAAGRGGSTGAAGSNGRGGSTGSGGGASTNLCTWPTANGSQSVSSTISVTGSYDGGMKRFTGAGALGGSGQEEGQDPLFEIENGGTLQNVIIGSPAADGVHCRGTCTLRNVWWEDVGEDAATLQGSSSTQTMTIDTGGAKAASDKIFQHNGPGTMIIKNFCAQDFGKLYRSCGNCSSQYTRHVEFDNIEVRPKLGPLAGVNANYNDTAKFTRILVRASSGSICDRYNGNSTGAEPTKIGSGADGTNCIYTASDITFMP